MSSKKKSKTYILTIEEMEKVYLRFKDEIDEYLEEGRIVYIRESGYIALKPGAKFNKTKTNFITANYCLLCVAK